MFSFYFGFLPFLILSSPWRSLISAHFTLILIACIASLLCVCVCVLFPHCRTLCRDYCILRSAVCCDFCQPKLHLTVTTTNMATSESSPIESNGGQRFSTAGGRSLTSFVWAVEDFERLDQTRYDSPTFIAPQNTRLFLALHPRGSNAFWSNSHTLLYLYLKSTDREKHLQLTYSLSLLNVDKQECDIQGEFSNRKTSVLIIFFFTTTTTLEGKAVFFKQSSKWVMRLNWQYNILRDYLLDGQNKFFHRDGRLRVVCKVK